jgi:hypothetical protein
MKTIFKLSLLMTIALAIIINEMSEAAALKDKHQLALKLNRLVRKRSSSFHQDQQFDEMNRCILACVKCSNEDLNDAEEKVCFIFCLK